MLKEQQKFRFFMTVERLMYTDYDTVIIINYMGLIIIQGQDFGVYSIFGYLISGIQYFYA